MTEPTLSRRALLGAGTAAFAASGGMASHADPAQDLTLLSATEAGKLMRERRISAVELTDAYLARIDKVDERLGSFIHVARNHARAAARQAQAELEAGRDRGPMHGIPFGVKDLFFTGDIPTTNNSRVDLSSLSGQWSGAVVRLNEAGGVLLGKMDTGEFATGTVRLYGDLPHPLARNPWDLTRFSGGSSTGPGAGVGGRTTLIGVGSDTGGSVRLPAAACGAQGLKPTYGRISRFGALENTWSRDTVGPIAWYVADCGIALQAMSGFDPRDPTSLDLPPFAFNPAIPADLRGVRVGVVALDGEEWSKVTPAIAAGLAATRDALRSRGAELVSVSLPQSLATYGRVAGVIGGVEFYISNIGLIEPDPSRVGQGIRDRLPRATGTNVLDYARATKRAAELGAEMEVFLRDYDLVLLPGTFHVAGRFNPPSEVADFMLQNAMVPASVTGHPSLTLRSGFSEAGLPTNVQFIARRLGEQTLLQVGMALEPLLDGTGPRRVPTALES
ncbi:amidase [Roseomonas sp. HJA6]|uniref:Amidase n=1 Tax=Roseomonas alba TaxID=2846776 RepID=A0ABS7AFF8_9PROT|nr:amidase [Neoroseomonas alba]MBW6401034.1 amidase [Neoroseomonas alba]